MPQFKYSRSNHILWPITFWYKSLFTCRFTPCTPISLKDPLVVVTFQLFIFAGITRKKCALYQRACFALDYSPYRWNINYFRSKRCISRETINRTCQYQKGTGWFQLHSIQGFIALGEICIYIYIYIVSSFQCSHLQFYNHFLIYLWNRFKLVGPINSGNRRSSWRVNSKVMVL